VRLGRTTLGHLNPMQHDCCDRLLQRSSSMGLRSASDQLCRQSGVVNLSPSCAQPSTPSLLFEDVLCIALWGLLGSLVNATVLGSLGSVAMTGMTHEESPNPYFWGYGRCGFLGSYCGLKQNPSTGCCRLDLLLGPHDLGTLAFTLRLAKGDCSFSMCASQRSTRIEQVPTNILEPSKDHARLEE
jgi:hypothetical protein